MIRSVVQGCGAYLPERVVTNDELAKTMDTSDEWIQQRTGIRQRHIAADGEFTSHLAHQGRRSARSAHAGVKASRPRPDRARHRHARPDLSRRPRPRVQAGARHDQGRRLRRPGGVRGLRLRAVGRRQHDQERPRLDRAGDRRRDLLAHPRLERPRHLRAVRRRRRRRRAEGRAGRGARRTIAACWPTRCTPTAASTTSSTSTAGRPRPGPPASCAWKARRSSSTPWSTWPPWSARSSRRPASTAKDIDWLVPHQANKRIIDGTGRKLGLPPERVVVTVDNHANTSAASIPLALDSRGERRPHQAGRSAAAGGHGRRPGLGRLARPLVARQSDTKIS